MENLRVRSRNLILEVLSALGGVATFCTAITVVVRALFRQSNAVKENTKALEHVAEVIEKIVQTQDEHGRDIAFLKGRFGRLKLP